MTPMRCMKRMSQSHMMRRNIMKRSTTMTIIKLLMTPVQL